MSVYVVFLSFNVFSMNLRGGYLVNCLCFILGIYYWLNMSPLAVDEMCMRFYENEH